ncbi:hypothetical protein DACRYDRAFT_76394 [Dacryopinax primogenitus]|uniref:Mei2-like C-terminal RNA recognition motif domain-containing protein n=1 Tax=Dacryopinax primogenitus (strain DJM 731) TaxID=1858805 RepID=M5G7A1_DACPD|nr:uncharacterized protein DACRYDRAFT_76394 [Dacryopinax primogenitus]EJU04075.1 hypothetical protein DACRYDRAFT_76394 [Dacryopinax primogenitus]
MTWPLPLRLPTPPLSASTTFSGGSSGADSPEFFIPTQTPPRRQGRVVHGTPGAQAAHAYLPAAARSVLEVLREPPPERNKLDLNRIREGLDTRTTVMLKNVPNKMTDKHLMAFIDTVTPKSYSFLYLRMDFENHCNVGYAFVNFMDVDSLLRFAETKLGKKWGMFNSEKVLNMSYANYQGKEALVEKFRNSGVMEEREAWRPKIFYSSGPRMGELEPFPRKFSSCRFGLPLRMLQFPTIIFVNSGRSKMVVPKASTPREPFIPPTMASPRFKSRIPSLNSLKNCNPHKAEFLSSMILFLDLLCFH